MARATRRFGLETVFGSTRHGGTSLLRAARRVLEQGQIAVFTPDGPRGPRMRAKPGVVRVAISAGVPIVPITFAASNQRVLASWDRFALALPFARGVLAFGAPLELGRDADPEAGRRLLEQRLNELTLESRPRARADPDRAGGMTLLALYRLATELGGPLIEIALRRRARRAKEDPVRLPERLACRARRGRKARWSGCTGRASAKRSRSCRCSRRCSPPAATLQALVTTGTVSSARLMAERLPERARHQFAPVDRPAAWRSFLDHWRPQLALLVESELWPNLILESRRRGVAMALVNGRMSARSQRRWARLPGVAADLLGRLRALPGAERRRSRSPERARGAAGAGDRQSESLGTAVACRRARR